MPGRQQQQLEREETDLDQRIASLRNGGSDPAAFGGADPADLGPPPPPAKRPRVAPPKRPSPTPAMAESEALVAQRQAAGQPSSPYVGVGWGKEGRRWSAEITHNGQYQRLGVFDYEEQAARAYDEAARRLRGDKAHGGKPARGSIFWKLNFPTEAEAAAAAEAATAASSSGIRPPAPPACTRASWATE